MAIFVRSAGPNLWEPGSWDEGNICYYTKVLGDFPIELENNIIVLPDLIDVGGGEQGCQAPFYSNDAQQVTIDNIECYTWNSLVEGVVPDRRGVWRGPGNIQYPTIASCFHAYWYTDWHSGWIYGTVSGNSILQRGINIDCTLFHSSTNIDIPNVETLNRVQIAEYMRTASAVSGTSYFTIKAKNISGSKIIHMGLNAPNLSITNSRLVNSGSAQINGINSEGSDCFITGSCIAMFLGYIRADELKIKNCEFTVKSQAAVSTEKLILMNFKGTLASFNNTANGNTGLTFINYHLTGGGYHDIINDVGALDLTITNDNTIEHKATLPIQWWIGNTPAQPVKVILKNCTFKDNIELVFSLTVPAPAADENSCGVVIYLEGVYFDPDDVGQPWSTWGGGEDAFSLNGFISSGTPAKNPGGFGVPLNDLNSPDCGTASGAITHGTSVSTDLTDTVDHSKLFGGPSGGTPVPNTAQVLKYQEYLDTNTGYGEPCDI